MKTKAQKVADAQALREIEEAKKKTMAMAIEAFSVKHKKEIKSLGEDKAFMKNVKELAELQVSKPSFLKESEFNSIRQERYNTALEERGKGIILLAIKASFKESSGKYSHKDALKYVRQEYKDAREMQASLLEDVLTGQAKPEVQAAYNKCAALLPRFNKQSFDVEICKRLNGKKITSETVLEAIDKIIGEIKTRMAEKALKAAIERERRELEEAYKSHQTSQSGNVFNNFRAKIKQMYKGQMLPKVDSTHPKVSHSVGTEKTGNIHKGTTIQAIHSLNRTNSMSDLNSSSISSGATSGSQNVVRALSSERLNEARNTNIAHQTGIVSALTQAFEYFRSCCSGNLPNPSHQIYTSKPDIRIANYVRRISSTKSAGYSSANDQGNNTQNRPVSAPSCLDNIKSYSIPSDSKDITSRRATGQTLLRERGSFSNNPSQNYGR